MSYVDAGYTIVLVALVLYAASLLARRRRLEHATRRGIARERGTDGMDGSATRDLGR